VIELTNSGIDRVIEVMIGWVHEATELIEDGTEEAIGGTGALIAEGTIGTDHVRIATRIEGVIVAIIGIIVTTTDTVDIGILGITIGIEAIGTHGIITGIEAIDIHGITMDIEDICVLGTTIAIVGLCTHGLIIDIIDKVNICKPFCDQIV